jgi:hypothetical protein
MIDRDTVGLTPDRGPILRETTGRSLDGCRAWTGALPAILLAGVLIGGSRVEAASPRFGDSTWVAPAAPIEGEPSAEGPRVAPRDHERGWETALRLPFRVAFLPLRVVASGLEYTAGFLGDRMVKPQSSKPESHDSRLSVGPQLDLIGLNDDGLRGVGLGPALTLKNYPTSTSNVTLQGSWSGVDRRRVTLTGVVGERRPVSFRLGAGYDYKPNRRYFGIGNQSVRENRGYFLLEETHAEATLSFGSSYEHQLGLVAGYSQMSPRRGYLGSPKLEDVFTPETAPFMHQDSRELLYGVTANLAAVDDRKHPSLGVHGRAEFRHARGLRDQDPDYHQWHVEARGYLPVFARRRVLVLRGAYAGVDPTSGGTMPFYRLVQSEQALRFAGYTSQRFRDRRLALGRLEYRWMVHRHLDAVALYELGEVAPHTRSFTARDVHVSYGGGVRFATSEKRMMRVEVARSIEGTHFALFLGGDI